MPEPGSLSDPSSLAVINAGRRRRSEHEQVFDPLGRSSRGHPARDRIRGLPRFDAHCMPRPQG